MSDQDRTSPYNSNNIKQTSVENKEKYHLGDYWLIQYQISWANIIRIVWQTVKRITNEILLLRGWIPWMDVSPLQVTTLPLPPPPLVL